MAVSFAGVKPGRKTVWILLDTLMSRYNSPGSIFLAIMAHHSCFLQAYWTLTASLQPSPEVLPLLILVGVVLDTLQQIEANAHASL